LLVSPSLYRSCRARQIILWKTKHHQRQVVIEEKLLSYVVSRDGLETSRYQESRVAEN
jgi:hypothetical protein